MHSLKRSFSSSSKSSYVHDEVLEADNGIPSTGSCYSHGPTLPNRSVTRNRNSGLISKDITCLAQLGKWRQMTHEFYPTYGYFSPPPFPFLGHNIPAYWDKVCKEHILHLENKAKLSSRLDSLGSELSAFKLDKSIFSRKPILRFEGGYIAFDRCRTVKQLPVRRDHDGVAMDLKTCFVDKTDTDGWIDEHLSLKVLHSSLFVGRNLGKGALVLPSDEEQPGWTDLPVNKNDLLITTETSCAKDHYLRVASASSGVEFHRIWLSNSLQYPDVGFQKACENLYVKSSMEPKASVGGGIVMTIWGIAPFRYIGGFRAARSVFGSDMESVGELDDTFVVCHKNELIRFYDLKPFFSSKPPTPVVIGEKWDSCFKFSTEPLFPASIPGFDSGISNGIYGSQNIGMPLTYAFTERPQLLYEVRSDLQYLALAMKQHHLLVADKKMLQFKLLNSLSGKEVLGSKLRTVNVLGSLELDPDAVLLVESTPERIAVWNGTQVIVYGLHSIGGVDEFELREDYVICPSLKGPCQVSTPLTGSQSRAKRRRPPERQESESYEQSSGLWSCDSLRYSFNMDLIIVIFRHEIQYSYKVAVLVDAQSGKTICTLRLKPDSREEHQEEVDLDEFGLTHCYRALNGKYQMDIYSLHDVNNLEQSETET